MGVEMDMSDDGLSMMQTEQQNKPSAYLPWVVCMVGGLFFFYEFIQMNALNAISHQLMRSFHIHAQTLGLMSSVYFYGDALLLLPAGLLLDRFSTRKTILFTLALAILGTLLFAVAHNVWLAMLSALDDRDC